MAAAADVKEDVSAPLTVDALNRAPAVTAGKRRCATGRALAAALRNACVASVLACLLNIFATRIFTASSFEGSRVPVSHECSWSSS